MLSRWIWGPVLAPKSRFFSGFAAEIAFYFSLALVPFLGVTLAAIGLAAPLDATEAFIRVLRDALPPEAGLDVESLVRSAKQASSGGWLTASFFLALWTSFRFVSATVRAVHFILGDIEERPRTQWLRRLKSLWLMIVWIVALASTALLLLVAPIIERQLAKLGIIAFAGLTAWRLVRSAAPLALLFAAFWTTYHSLCGLARLEGEVWRAAAVATGGWFGLSLAFTHLVPHLFHYSEVYGALGGFIAFLFWAYLSAWAVLLGACSILRFNTQSGHPASAPASLPPLQ